ncbi:MAG: hypothetical protein M3N29_09860 [Chloroflexota bacterium]|nr:hypothetical protein [Chloroflexota bacterium]
MASNAPIRISFDKSIVDPGGVWEGTVSGAVDGDLTTHLLAAPDETGQVWHVSFDWVVVADDPDYSFVALTEGILNLRTGRVVMNGTVDSGWMAGARVHEEGQLIDAASLRFQGEITILPATR